ncbi:unnamed protein product [Aureobasidium pullulans]|nr:unnamed protein product [Aureobasidium pullulans]
MATKATSTLRTLARPSLLSKWCQPTCSAQWSRTLITSKPGAKHPDFAFAFEYVAYYASL